MDGLAVLFMGQDSIREIWRTRRQSDTKKTEGPVPFLKLRYMHQVFHLDEYFKMVHVFVLIWDISLRLQFFSSR